MNIPLWHAGKLHRSTKTADRVGVTGLSKKEGSAADFGITPSEKAEFLWFVAGLLSTKGEEKQDWEHIYAYKFISWQEQVSNCIQKLDAS